MRNAKIWQAGQTLLPLLCLKNYWTHTQNKIHKPKLSQKGRRRDWLSASIELQSTSERWHGWTLINNWTIRRNWCGEYPQGDGGMQPHPPRTSSWRCRAEGPQDQEGHEKWNWILTTEPTSSPSLPGRSCQGSLGLPISSHVDDQSDCHVSCWYLLLDLSCNSETLICFPLYSDLLENIIKLLSSC